MHGPLFSSAGREFRRYTHVDIDVSIYVQSAQRLVAVWYLAVHSRCRQWIVTKKCKLCKQCHQRSRSLFYHDVDEIFWPQPIRSLKLGHVTGQGSISPTWVGRVSDNISILAIECVAAIIKSWHILRNWYYVKKIIHWVVLLCACMENVCYTVNSDYPKQW